jgi:hypothetical protein
MVGGRLRMSGVGGIFGYQFVPIAVPQKRVSAKGRPPLRILGEASSMTAALASRSLTLPS